MSADRCSRFAGLSERSRRLRFLGPKPRLSGRDLDAFVDIERREREAIVAVEAATGRAIGIARFVAYEDGRRAESHSRWSTPDRATASASGWPTSSLRRFATPASSGVEATLDAGNEPARALLRRLGRIESRRFVEGELEVIVALTE